MLNRVEKEVLLYISKRGLSISERPFKEAADVLSTGEKEVLGALRGLKERGIIKDLRGVLNHNKAGYSKNSLIAWNVPSEKVEAIKVIFMDNDLISHCYEREPHDKFNFNIFTMMHADNAGILESFAGDISKKFDINCKILFTEEELKRESIDLEELLCSMT
jgi:DNA-binding Lrp family transcriptional regulator